MIILRDYQKEAVDIGVEYLKSKSRKTAAEILPTAAGKSIIIAHIVKELDGEVLILQPSKELLEQNYRKYDALVKQHEELEIAGIYSASVGIKERRRVTYATIGSIAKKSEMFRRVKYILIDECHKVPPKKDSMYRKFLDKLDAQVLGLSATPYRLKTYRDPFNRRKKISKVNLLPRERPRFFDDFIYVVQTSEMYKKGYLCPVNYISMTFDGSFLEFNSTGAEYSDKSLKKAMDQNKIIEKIPGILRQAFEKGQRSCLVFVREVDEARRLASIVPYSNFLHALTPKKERAQIIADFKSGSIKTLFNVAVLTEGFDYPELDTVIVARPTMSLALFVQMVGRGIRIHENKEKCTLLDMCGNLKRFGKLEELAIEKDEKGKWVLRNEEKILSGVALNEL